MAEYRAAPAFRVSVLTSTVIAERSEVRIAAPLPQQEPIVQSAARFKVVRAGRRFGKTRLALYCAIVGHGPGEMFPGIASGKDVAWVAPEYKNSDVIWEEDIKPRFRNALGVKTNDTDHILEVPGGGRLVLVTAKNIDAIRGIGKNLAGVIADEAGYMDLGYAIRAVLRPAMMDLKAWLLLMSTTNSGWDGNIGEDGEKVHPSFFNRLCAEIQEGKRDARWAEFYGTAHDNPKLDAQEIADLIAEYQPNSLELDQEIYARLRAPGAGLAFPEWRDDVHVVATREPPRHWKWVAAMDWGYRQGAYGLFALGPEGEVELAWEYYAEFRQKHAREAAVAIARASEAFPVPEYIAADTQMWSEVGTAETLAEEFREGLVSAYRDRAPELVEMTHTAKSRKVKKNLLHRYLAWTDKRDEQGRVQPWCRPLLRVQQRCQHTIRTLKALPLDPNTPEDVDTSSEDHAYDMVCFALTSRPPVAETPRAPFDQDNRHPGFDYEQKRVRTVGFEDEPETEGWKVPVAWRVPRG